MFFRSSMLFQDRSTEAALKPAAVASFATSGLVKAFMEKLRRASLAEPSKNSESTLVTLLSLRSKDSRFESL